MVSYELALGLSLIAVLMVSGTMQMSEIVSLQQQHGWKCIVSAIWVPDILFYNGL